MPGELAAGVEPVEMTEPVTYDKTFNAAFKASGVPKELRTPEHYFFVTDTVGNPYPIPTEIAFVFGKDSFGRAYDLTRPDVHSGWYKLSEEGAAVAYAARVDKTATLSGRVVVENGVTIDPRVEIGLGWIVRQSSNIHTGSQLLGRRYCETEIGFGTNIANEVTIGPANNIGKLVTIGYHSSTESDVEIGDNSTLDPKVAVGYGTKIGKNVKIKKGAKIENNGRIMDGALVREGKRIKANTLVASPFYDKVRKSHTKGM